MAKVNFKIEGMDELTRGFKRIGGIPKKYATSASRKAMNPVLKRAKANAPEGETRNLKKGIILTGERSPKGKAKKVYRVVFDRRMNEVFQKPNKEGKITGYYPVSQEYGFFARNGKYIPGFRFVHESFNGAEIERTIVNEMKFKIEQQISKEGL